MLAPLPAQMRDHPRGVGRMPDAGLELTNPNRGPGGRPSVSTSQPVADPLGSRVHRIRPDKSSGQGIKAMKDPRIVKGDSKAMPTLPREPDREPKFVNTGSRAVVKMKPLERIRGPRPPPLPPRGKGPGRGPGGNSG